MSPSGPGWGLDNEVFQVGGLLDGDKTLVVVSGGGGGVHDYRMVTQGQGGFLGQATRSKCR